MKLNKIILFFLLALPAGMVMRFLQLYFTVETKTGFYTAASGNYGSYLLILIFLFTFATAVFAFFAHSRPEQPPKANIYLNLSAVLLGIGIFNEVIISASSASLILWQGLLLKILGVAASLFFLLFALAPVAKFKLPAVAYVIPTLYILIRIVCDFTTISRLALISDNILLIGAYCIILLFMLNFAKLYNNADSEKNFKKLLGYGLASVILCFVNAIPNIVINVTTESGYLHTPMATNISLLFFGIFIATFLISHFSRKNLQN